MKSLSSTQGSIDMAILQLDINLAPLYSSLYHLVSEKEEQTA